MPFSHSVITKQIVIILNSVKIAYIKTENTREHRGLSDGPFCTLPGAPHANMRPPLASHIVLFVEFFTKASTSILTRWLLFKNLHNRTGLIE